MAHSKSLNMFNIKPPIIRNLIAIFFFLCNGLNAQTEIFVGGNAHLMFSKFTQNELNSKETKNRADVTMVAGLTQNITDKLAIGLNVGNYRYYKMFSTNINFNKPNPDDAYNSNPKDNFTFIETVAKYKFHDKDKHHLSFCIPFAFSFNTKDISNERKLISKDSSTSATYTYFSPAKLRVNLGLGVEYKYAFSEIMGISFGLFTYFNSKESPVFTERYEATDRNGTKKVSEYSLLGAQTAFRFGITYILKKKK